MVFIKIGVKKCNETVYRTTPATRGLLNLYIIYQDGYGYVYYGP